MNNFALQEWHIFLLFFSLIGNIFKNDIVNAIKASITIFEQRAYSGKTVELLNPDGAWTTVTIVDYQHSIPFVKGGGVFLLHTINEQEIYREKVSFQTWSAQRIRFPHTA